MDEQTWTSLLPENKSGAHYKKYLLLDKIWMHYKGFHAIIIIYAKYYLGRETETWSRLDFWAPQF